MEITVAELEDQVIDLKQEMKQKAKTMQEDIDTLKTLNFTNEEIQELPPPILSHELSSPYFQQLSTDMTSQIPTAFPPVSYPPIQPHYSTPVKPILPIDHESSSSQLSIDMISSPSPIAFLLVCHHKNTSKTTLLSSVIEKSKLLPCDTVLDRYSKLKNESRIGTLAVKLAREVFFGEEIFKEMYSCWR